MAFLIKWGLIALLIFFFGCGTYENPYDPQNADADFDGDGLKNGEDPDPKVVNNSVKAPSGSTGTSTNVSKNWVFFSGSETFDTSVTLAPDGYSLPTLDEVKAGIASGELLSVKNRVWTTTKTANSSYYEAVIPANSDILSAHGTTNKFSSVFKKR